jgi:hypothetical protein
MRRFFATEAAVTNRRRWRGGRECGGRRGRGQHDVRANSAGTPTDLPCLFVCLRFFPDVTMRIHSLSRVPSKVLASSIHSLAHKSNAWLFIDSVFPVKLAAWESVIHSFPCTFDTHIHNSSFRYFFGHLRQERLLDSLSQLITQVDTHGFKPISMEPLVKDGGVFVLFEYTPSQSEDVLSNIQSDLRNHIQSQGGVPSSAGLCRGDIWIVQGQPWREVPYLSSSALLSPQFQFRT